MTTADRPRPRALTTFRRARVGLAITALTGISLAVISLAGLAPAGALAGGAAEGVQIEAVLDGQPATGRDGAAAVVLDPARTSRLEIRVTNTTASDLSVRTLRLEGRLLGLTFFSYDVSARFHVAPGTTEARAVDVDLAGLGGQARGLVPARLLVLDDEREVVAAEALVVDVRGSWSSVTGLFAGGLLALTIGTLVSALTALARGRLHPDRWRRAMRFAVPGLGLGLTATVAVGAFRIVTPSTGRGVGLAAVLAMAGLAAGWLTPSPFEPVEADIDSDGRGRDDECAQHIELTDPDGLLAPLETPVEGLPAPTVLLVTSDA